MKGCTDILVPWRTVHLHSSTILGILRPALHQSGQDQQRRLGRIACFVGTPNTFDKNTLFALRRVRERDIEMAAIKRLPYLNEMTSTRSGDSSESVTRLVQ